MQRVTISEAGYRDGRTAYTYDKAGNIVQVEDPMGYLLRYTYDRDNTTLKCNNRFEKKITCKRCAGEADS